MTDGPSPETLRHLAAMLPGLVRGQRSGGIGKSGLKLVPTSVCSLCGKAHNFVGVKAPALPVSAPCDACREQLTTSTALKSKDGRFAFIASPKFPVGKVVVIEDKEMDRVQARHQQDTHRADIQRVLSEQGLLRPDGTIDGWREDTWERLKAEGHDQLQADQCQCGKKA